ncbi:MAG: TolC family protein [Treponema sp.]|nr:TolC family protein [Treponema sp.]
MYKKLAVIFLCCSLSVEITGAQDTLTFSQAAELAAAKSLDLRHSRASQAVMEGAWRWGLRAYFPRLGITVSENDRLQQTGADSFIKNYGISLDQLIWDFKIPMSRKLEKMEIDFTSARLDRLSSAIEESAISAYRNILLSRKILSIRKDALLVLEEQRRIMDEEALLGLALNVDLASADINLSNARLDIFSLQLDLYEMEKQFAELLGLETLPVLSEKIDINRSLVLPAAGAAAVLAKNQNPDLADARFSIAKKQAELHFISSSWVPSLRLNGNFGLTGQRYPLTRYNWSVGISLEFSNPWFQNRFGAQTGWEPSSPGQYDRTAMIQNSFTPLPDPAASYGMTQARLALELEREKYSAILEQIGRVAHNAVEKCALMEQRRILALEAASIGSERCRIEEIRLGLGHITRLKLMETLIEQTQREIAAAEAATALLEAERELEKLLDLKPGELIKLAAVLQEPHHIND